MKLHPFSIGLLLMLPIVVTRAQLTENYTYTPGLVIPDGNATGVSDSHVISGSNIPQVGSLTVSLGITGNFNGDLYLYLRHEREVTAGNFAADGFSVLLNRAGRDSG